MKRREFLAGSIALAGCAGSPHAPNIAEPIPPVPTPEPMANNSLLASDNFASGSLAAGWTVAQGMAGVCAISGAPHYAQPTAISTLDGQVWTGLAFPADQTSEVTIQTMGPAGTQNSVLLMTRWQSGAFSGYQLLLRNDATNHSAILQRVDAGVGTQLATNTTITHASGDVWTLQSAGSCHSVYQNGHPIFTFIFDATYTTGSPGFQCYSTQAVTNAQVSAWRGYNAVQTDGIWTKQGVIIAPPASSIATTTSGGLFLNTTIFKGTGIVLSGQVYYTWMCGGITGSTAGVYYAESFDGKNWTFYSGNPVLATLYFPDVFLSGGTYYMYVQSSAAVGTGNMQLYTSTNRTTWTLVNSAVIALGTAGQWDAGAIYAFTVVDIIAGTWYALYAGANSFTTQIYKIGLATAPDGVTWTKSGGNPILTAANGGALSPSAAFVKLGSTYYMWFQGSNPGMNTAVINPTDTVRYQSTNLTSWTNPVQSVHHMQLFEGVNTNVGDCVPNSIMQVGNQTWLYLTSGTNGPAPQNWQVELAIAPATLASIVQVPENTLGQVAADTFARGAGGLGPNWTIPSAQTGLQIASSGVVEPLATGTNCIEFYNGSFGTSQYSQVTIGATMAASSYVTPCVYVQPNGLNCYYAVVGGPTGSLNTININKFVNGVATNLTTAFNFTPQVGDVMTLTVSKGSDGFNVLTLYQNGFLVMQVQDYSNAFTSGNPGVLMVGATVVTNSQLSAFAGGNTNVSPFAGGGGGDLGPGYDFFYRF